VSVSQDFAQRLYQQAQAQQPAGDAGAAGGAGASAPSDDDVADAEIVDEPGQESA
jgi:molecular chaperone DnaK